MIISAVIIGDLDFLGQFMQFCKTYVAVEEHFSGHCLLHPGTL